MAADLREAGEGLIHPGAARETTIQAAVAQAEAPQAEATASSEGGRNAAQAAGKAAATMMAAPVAGVAQPSRWGVLLM